MGGGLLFDRDGRRQALDVVHVGLVHHRQELPGIGRQGFHIAALALGIDGVESQRGLAGAGQARDHDQPVPGQVQVQVPEVVGPRAADADVLHLLRGCVCYGTGLVRSEPLTIRGGAGAAKGLSCPPPECGYPALHKDMTRNPDGFWGGPAYNVPTDGCGPAGPCITPFDFEQLELIWHVASTR